MNKRDVNIAVIGLGVIGLKHIEHIKTIPGTKITAVCARTKEKVDKIASDNNCKAYTDVNLLLKDNEIDSIVIATPHPEHKDICINAFRAGKNVLCEKPIAVDVLDGIAIVNEYKKQTKIYPKLTFSVIFQQRTFNKWKKIKELIENNALGTLQRVTWIITTMFRTNYYYKSSPWRATWNNEGGGVLINQALHELDLFQWFFGIPDRVRGFCSLGKYHNISVEDEATAYFEYDTGLVAHFITSTSETPGVNRLEIVGENGRLLFENEKIVLYKNESSSFDFIRNFEGDLFKKPEFTVTEISYDRGVESHKAIIENFINTVKGEGTLFVNGEEGLNSLTIANAIILSSFENRTIDIPFDPVRYRKLLKKFQKQEL